MSRTIFLLWGTLAIASLGAGCSTLVQHQAAEAESLVEDSAQQQQDSYLVELRPSRGKRERVEVDFTGVPYVQQALEESGATDEFRRMDVMIIRKSDGQVQKMRSSYDHVRHQVPIEWDYALYPGDLIIVTEDPSSMFDDMVKSALGPLAGIAQ